jgi:Asparagine synthase
VTPYLSADLMRRGALVELAQFFGTLRRSYQLHPLALARHALWRCGLHPLAGLTLHRLMPEVHQAWRLERQLAADPTWVAPDPELRAEQRRRAAAAMMPWDPPQGFYFQELLTSLRHSVVSWDTEERHELGKRIGVRFLHPFLDPDVVELLYRTPPRVLNEGGRTKGLVRRTLAQRFPALELDRQRKVVATSFYRSLLLREGPALADAAGDFPALSALGLVDGRATRAFVREELKQPGPRLQRIFGIFNLEMWILAHRGR